MKKIGDNTKTVRRAARPPRRVPNQKPRLVRSGAVDRRRRRPPHADAVADIEKHDPNFVERELKRIYADCKVELERRRARNAVVDKLKAVLVEARQEMERGWLPDREPRTGTKVLVSWQSPVVAEELERFDRACSELQSLLVPFPGESMTVERMFVRKASLIATYEEMALTLSGRPRGKTEEDRLRDQDKHLGRVRALMKEIKADPIKDGTIVFGG